MSSFCTIVKHNIDSQIYADSKTIPLLPDPESQISDSRSQIPNPKS